MSKVRYTDGQVATYVAMACASILEVNKLTITRGMLERTRTDHKKMLSENQAMSQVIAKYSKIDCDFMEVVKINEK